MPKTASAWTPFRHPAFAVLWTAMLVSNIGTWMHDVGAGWLMTTLAPSPLMVALVQAASTLPVFLLALPSGALADIVDRRGLLIAAKSGMALFALGLGVVVLTDHVTPAVLLGFTFAMGLGTALVSPAWQAIVPQLVPRTDLASAVALNSVGINVSRAIGPALGGAVIAALGLAAPFFLNAFSFLAVIGALIWWPQPPRVRPTLPGERWLAAMRMGARYARSSPPLRATFVRAVAFLIFASAYWALLPLIAREQLGGGAGLYATLVTCIGGGAVGGALLLPRFRERFGAGRVVFASALLTAGVLVVFALRSEPALGAAAAVVAGAAWISALSSFNVSAQMSLPDWVRARGLALFSAVLYGSLAGGSALWGQTAAILGISGALLVAAAGIVVAALLTMRVPLQTGGELDLTPSAAWPEPVVAGTVDADRGPVMVTIEYRVDPSRVAGFLAALDALAPARRRNGAFAWGVFRDAGDQSRYLEYFMEESWTEHLRHHARVTKTDRELQARVLAFHLGPEPPHIEHLLAPGDPLKSADLSAVTGSLRPLPGDDDDRNPTIG
jgi:predicted MFS family arabinose efflux permease